LAFSTFETGKMTIAGNDIAELAFLYDGAGSSAQKKPRPGVTDMTNRIRKL
jgi:hypothetical protein